MNYLYNAKGERVATFYKDRFEGGYGVHRRSRTGDYVRLPSNVSQEELERIRRFVWMRRTKLSWEADWKPFFNRLVKDRRAK